MIEYKAFIAGEIAQLIERVSAMRVAYFREYPYLYDGSDSSEYEKLYLHELSRNKHSIITTAGLDGELAGIATALPLASGADILAGIETKFIERGYNPSTFYYLSEVIVVPHCRGHGIATQLYRALETQAREWGYARGCLATVKRDPHDVRKPTLYAPPRPLWPKFGYRRTDIGFNYDWKTFGADGSSRELTNAMEIWIKDDLRRDSSNNEID